MPRRCWKELRNLLRRLRRLIEKSGTIVGSFENFRFVMRRLCASMQYWTKSKFRAPTLITIYVFLMFFFLRFLCGSKYNRHVFSYYSCTVFLVFSVVTTAPGNHFRPLVCYTNPCEVFYLPLQFVPISLGHPIYKY